MYIYNYSTLSEKIQIQFGGKDGQNINVFYTFKNYKEQVLTIKSPITLFIF
jgi:hypothetical protein